MTSSFLFVISPYVAATINSYIRDLTDEISIFNNLLLISSKYFMYSIKFIIYRSKCCIPSLILI